MISSLCHIVRYNSGANSEILLGCVKKDLRGAYDPALKTYAHWFNSIS